MADRPSQFYTGLIAELYDPLVGHRATADDYVPFLDRCESPHLELGCGSGRPLLDLVERGYPVHGLDSSADMLALCTWVTRWWDQPRFREMLLEAGFSRATAILPDGSRARPDSSPFVFLAQRDGARAPGPSSRRSSGGAPC